MTDFSKAKYSLLALYSYEPEAFNEELQEIAEAITSGSIYDEHPSLNRMQLTRLLQEISDSVDVDKLALINEIDEKRLRLEIKQILLASSF